MNQSTSTVFMVRPYSFRSNEETAINNHYQRDLTKYSPLEIIQQAQTEFDGFVSQLLNAGVEVIVFDEAKPHRTPDAVFPNNWISTHASGALVLYPMFAPNRRTERREDIPRVLEHQFGFNIREVVDLTEYESQNKFLEGTGSIVLDRVNRKAYAALSDRTDIRALDHFCAHFGFTPITFNAFQTFKNERLLIYHTNVMMCIGTHYAVVCLDCIDSVLERQKVHDSLVEDGLALIQITEDQVNQFAGNMLELRGSEGPILVMSSSAFASLPTTQIDKLNQFATVLHAPLKTIETCGGGSARCMIAEIHLPKQNA